MHLPPWILFSDGFFFLLNTVKCHFSAAPTLCRSLLQFVSNLNCVCMYFTKDGISDSTGRNVLSPAPGGQSKFGSFLFGLQLLQPTGPADLWGLRSQWEGGEGKAMLVVPTAVGV